MGRYYWYKKDTVEGCRSVSISFLRKHGYFCGYRTGGIAWKNCYDEETGSIGITVSTSDSGGVARFYYTVTDRSTGEKTDYDYKVQLTTTSCHFGGVRYWFVCPLYKNGVYCGRRVAKLYRAPGAAYFGCRHCYDLSYESRNESRLGRPGGLCYPLKLECQIERLYGQIRRRFYAGRRTRKFRRVLRIQNRLNAYVDSPAARHLLRR